MCTATKTTIIIITHLSSCVHVQLYYCVGYIIILCCCFYILFFLCVFFMYVFCCYFVLMSVTIFNSSCVYPFFFLHRYLKNIYIHTLFKSLMATYTYIRMLLKRNSLYVSVYFLKVSNC